MAYQSVNPANGEVLRTFDQHTDEEVRNSLSPSGTTSYFSKSKHRQSNGRNRTQ